MVKERDPIEALRALVRKHGSQTAAAKALGIGDAHMCDMLKGRRGVSLALLPKLGLRRAVVAA